jgi:hypothetical protein
MRKWRVLAETDLLAGLSHSLVEYVSRNYKVSASLLASQHSLPSV